MVSQISLSEFLTLRIYDIFSSGS